MNYWIEGVASIIRRLNNAPGETESQLTLELEQAGNRISDLETENTKLRRALQLAATSLDMTYDDIMQQTESGASTLRVPQKPKETEKSSQQQEETVEDTNSKPAVQDTTVSNENDVSEHTEEDKSANNEKQEKAEDPEPTNEEEENSAQEDEVVDDEEEESESESEIDTSGHFGATVKFDYEARKNYELSIKKGDIITVVSQHDNGWWLGCDGDGKQGYFPGSYVVAIDS